MRKLLWFVLFLPIISCSTSKVDLIIHHAVIYTVDSTFTVAEAMAVKDGKIVAVGKNEEIQKNKFAHNQI